MKNTDVFFCLQLLRDVGIPTDLIPVGREVAGVVQQGCFYTNTENCVISSTLTVCSFLTVGENVSFFQPDHEVVGRIFTFLSDLHQ